MSKFLKIVSGVVTEEAAVVTGGTASEDGKLPALDATGKLDDSVMPDGVGAETIVLPASEALLAGDMVNVWDDGGTIKVQKATAADNTKPAHGYVVAGYDLGANATIYTDGYLTTTGLTAGSKYFLSAAAAGEITATAPSGSAQVVQLVGFALSATKLAFEQHPHIQLATTE